MDAPMPRPTRSGLIVLAVGLGLLLGLYVAAAGPAARLAYDQRVPFRVWSRGYRPLFWLRAAVPWFRHPSDWYLKQCGV
jgi:hypothetical protein